MNDNKFRNFILTHEYFMKWIFNSRKTEKQFIAAHHEKYFLIKSVKTFLISVVAGLAVFNIVCALLILKEIHKLII